MRATRIAGQVSDCGPSSSPAASRHRWEAIAGFALLAAALSVYVASVVRVDVIGAGMAHPGPEPDCAEYFAMMCSIRDGNGPVIRIAGDDLPSRYPHGFSALAVPLFRLVPPEQAICVPFLANKVWGAATMLVVFAFFALRGGTLRGGIAVAIIATLPAFMAFSRSSMSDSLGAFLVVCAFLAMSVACQGRVTAYLFSAALMGLALNVRVSLVTFLPLLAAPLFVPAFGSRGQRLSAVVAGGFVAGICASPCALVNQAQFGSPLTTGYSYWLAGFDSTKAFGLKHVVPNLVRIWEEITMTAGDFTPANVFGTGTHFVPASALLVLVFVWPARWTAFHWVAAVSLCVALFMSLVYFFVALRLYYPFMLLAAIGASGGVARALCNWRGSGQIAWAVLAISLLAATVLGYPSRSGYPPESGRMQLVDGIAWAGRRADSLEYEAALLLMQEAAPPEAVVLSDINPAFLSALVGPRLTCAPIDAQHAYCNGHEWRFDKTSALALAERSLERGLPVYALAVRADDHSRTLGRLPRVDGARWLPVGDESPGRPAIWELVRDLESPAAPAPASK